MFRALVTASALLTATLAAVLFMPGVGRQEVETAPAPAATGDMELGDERAEAGASALPAVVPDPVAEKRTEAGTGHEAPPADPGPVMADAAGAVGEAPVAPEGAPLEVEQVQPEAAPLAKAGPAPDPLTNAATLADMVALSAPAADEPHTPELVRRSAATAPHSLPAARPVAEPDVAPARDMRALSAEVLAGLGMELPPEPTEPEARISAQRRHVASYSSERALEEAAGWSTDYVLIALGKGPRKVTTPLEDAQEWSTNYVLKGLAEAGATPRAPREGAVSLEEVIASAIEEGRSDAYLIALIDQLSAAGQLEAPAALMKADGQVDSGLVLNALVRASTASAPGQGPVPRPARRLSKAVTYTVRRGDSLAGIALRFYGVTDRYTLIFDANRAALESPDQIRPGQRLTIPAG